MTVRHPFGTQSALTMFQRLLNDVTQEIKLLDTESVLKEPLEDLEEHYIAEAKLSPLVLKIEKKCRDEAKPVTVEIKGPRRPGMNQGKKRYVRGTSISIHVPYEGDEELWWVQPSSGPIEDCPGIELMTGEIVFVVQFADELADPEKLNSEIDEKITCLARGVQELNRDVENHNASVRKIIRKAIEDRRTTAEGVQNALESLRIPIKRRDQPLTYAVPVKRKPSVVYKPKVTQERCEPEPVLQEEEYEHILRVMRDMSLVIERNPTSFISLDEPTIRTLFLVVLNGHYEGKATGETFNAAGKTDILIREGDRNVFIAECKFWGGTAKFNKAVNQLLSYLSWRDSKAALLIFNKNKNSTAVRRKMNDAMQKHRQYKKTVCHDSHGDSRYIFVNKSDPDCQITITTQLYDVPSA